MHGLIVPNRLLVPYFLDNGESNGKENGRVHGRWGFIGGSMGIVNPLPRTLKPPTTLVLSILIVAYCYTTQGVLGMGGGGGV